MSAWQKDLPLFHLEKKEQFTHLFGEGF